MEISTQDCEGGVVLPCMLVCCRGCKTSAVSTADRVEDDLLKMPATGTVVVAAALDRRDDERLTAAAEGTFERREDILLIAVMAGAAASLDGATTGAC